MPKYTLTADEYYTRLKDLAENGSTFVGFDGECYIQDSERETAIMELYYINEDDDLFNEQLWYFNATAEEVSVREYLENGPYGVVRD
jgi:hypothetical protein